MKQLLHRSTDMTDSVDNSHADILESIEAKLHQMAERDLESDLSVNEWIQRVRGAAQEAHMFARTGQAGLEEQSWLEMAAICVRRIDTIRALAADGHKPAQEVKEEQDNAV